MASLRFVRLVISLAQTKTGIYVFGKGAQCPVCLELGFKAEFVKSYSVTLPLRYFRCPNCGANFKTTNEPEKPVAMPTKLHYHKRGKRK